MASEILKKNDEGVFTSINVDAVKQLPESAPAAEMAAAAQAVGYRMAFRWVTILPAILVVIFTMIILYDRSRGGYKPEILISRQEENELLAGGVQGPVE
jgi:hypothetical protein